MKKLPLLLILLFAGILSKAQNQNNRWYFGQNAGLDFNSGNPVALTGGALNSTDNTATISDASGNLLFYTDGVTVWNKLHNVMTNGTGLMGDQTGGQPATIVPYPGNSNLYYIFTVDKFAFSNGLRYSIVDMSQQSGNGAVTATKNVLIYTPSTEKVIAVRHCNRRDYWLITHAWNSNQFEVYLIDNNGFNSTPVVSATGTTHTGGSSGYYNACGQMTVSKDGSRIGLCLYSAGIAEFLDFNNTNGTVSNPVTLTGYTNAWGIEFSEDAHVAYIDQWQGSQIWQVNLLAGNAAAIQASTYLVGNASGPHPTYRCAYMKRGPDDKIYIAKYTSSYLSVVNNPDVLGSGCNWVDDGFNLGGPLSTAGLDNCVAQNVNVPTLQVSGLCQDQFSISDTTGVNSYAWNFGDTASVSNNSNSPSPTHAFSGAGTYTVQVVLNYGCFNDTLSQVITTPGNALAQFTSSVANCDSVVTFSNTSSNSTSYLWNFGDSTLSVSTNPIHTYNSSGTYTISLVATNSCGSDTMIQVVPITVQPMALISGTSEICEGQSVTLNASGGNSVQWSGGSNATTSSINVTPAVTTTYYATVSNGACISLPDTFVIIVDTLPVVQISGSSSICSGQNVTLTASGSGAYQWSGGSSATTSSISVTPGATTTFYVTVDDGQCTSSPDTFTVNVVPVQNVTIVGPSAICMGQTVVLTATGASSYQWSGGANDTTAAISVSPTTGTTYYASPVNSMCPGTPDTLTVSVLPTPIVNVGGNTTICAGQSTTLTASGGTSYQWSGGASDTTASITVSPAITTTYFVSTSNGVCSSGYDTIIVTVVPSPTASIVAPNAVCPGTLVTLTAVGNATTYVWAGGASGTGTTITDNPTVTTNYWLVGYNSLGCSDTDMVTVIVYDVSTFTILGDDTICSGESTSLMCSGSGTFNWSPPTGLNSTTTQTVVANPTVTTTYSVQVTDINGCTGGDSFTLYIEPCTGVEEHENRDNWMYLSPNPSAGVFELYTSMSGIVTLEILDVSGKVVRTENLEQNGISSATVDLTDMADGIYMFRLTNGDQTMIQRGIISR